MTKPPLNWEGGDARATAACSGRTMEPYPRPIPATAGNCTIEFQWLSIL